MNLSLLQRLGVKLRLRWLRLRSSSRDGPSASSTSAISRVSIYTNEARSAASAVSELVDNSDTSMQGGGWYQVVNGSSLEQGDILIGITTPRAIIDSDGQGLIRVGVGSYVVLSQTCDLENDKVKEVLLANVISYQQLAHEVGANARSTKFRDALDTRF